MSNMSDISEVSGGPIPVGRNRMEVVCVLDTQHLENLEQRKQALEAVKQACIQVNANFNLLPVSEIIH